MTPFTTLTAPALALIEDRIDTDILFPARFLLLMDKDGLGRYLCHDRRFDTGGQPIDNPIDPALDRGAGILLSGREFGCGSSREQAVWALSGAGFTCVIAESFGEIFAANCLRNGVLAITLEAAQIAMLRAVPGDLTVDLERQTIGWHGGSLSLAVPPATRERLLNGWDEIDMIVARAGNDIAAFETAQRRTQPWLY